MKNYILTIRKELQNNLSLSAIEYLKTAMDLSMKGKTIKFTGDYRTQPVVGNFAIAIELMLKAFIFSKNPALVFNLPLELRVAFISPESVGEGVNLRPCVLQLRSFDKITALELSELIKTFDILRPDLKQELQPFFTLFAQCRNVSVHAALPSFQKYEVERTAYLALRIFKEIAPTFGIRRHAMLREVEAMLESLDTERAHKVHNKMVEAKKVAQKLRGKTPTITSDGWDSYVTECPVCRSEGVLNGDTDIDYGRSEEDMSLNFLAESFMCDQCKLELVDIKEMKLAGMTTLYDRNDDINVWLEEHEDHEIY